MKGNATLKDCVNSFLLPKQTAASIVNKGCQAMAVIFGGTRTDSLSSLSYNVLGKKVVSSQSFITPVRLPPTESSNKFHCLRVYYQIMVRLGQESDMDTCEWVGNGKAVSLCQQSRTWMRPQIPSWRLSTATAQLPVALPGVAVGRTIYPVPRLVDSANLMSVTIRTISQYWMKTMTRTHWTIDSK